MVIVINDKACNRVFYFQGSGLPLSFSGTWLNSVLRLCIALQKVQAVALMLCRMERWLPCIWTEYCYSLCNQGGTVSHFLSRACCILSLDEKHGITFIPAYIPTHLNVEADYHDNSWFQNGIFILE